MSSNKSEYLTILGDRLAEERNRCGHTQKSVADHLAITARTQIKYEIGETAPDAYYLHGLGEIGLDVTYVLTGTRGAQPSDEESDLIASYRRIDSCCRTALVDLLACMVRLAGSTRKRRHVRAVEDALRETSPGEPDAGGEER